MNIFINTISSNSVLILFDNNRNILDKLVFQIKGNESSLLIPKIDELLKANNLNYNNLDNIVVVNGPGSFTWIRTTILAANTINYIIKKNMTAISFFELYKNYPIIKSSSKRDSFIMFEKSWKIEIINNEEIKELLNKKNIKKIYWESSIEDLEIVENIDYISIIKELKLDKKEKLEALYIKKPNIC